MNPEKTNQDDQSYGAQGLVCDGFLTFAVNSNNGLTFETLKTLKQWWLDIKLSKCLNLS